MAEQEGDGDVKDLTITSFGLIIAYLLPGLVGLYGLSYWFPSLKSTFSTFLTAESNIGLFLIVLMASLVVGMLAHGIRWLVFEEIAGTRSKYRVDSSLYANLSGERILSAFQTIVDEWYRYHQWWGGFSVVAPIVYFGWITSSDTRDFSVGMKAILSIGFVALEAFVIFVAWRVWIICSIRTQWILKGDDNMGGTPSPSPHPNPNPNPHPHKGV